MIIRSMCNSCYQVYDITSEPSDVHLLKEIIGDDLMAPCPRLCGGRINMVSSKHITDMSVHSGQRVILPITAKELFKAVKGAGLPDEVPKSADVIDLLFKASPIKSVRTETVGGRLFLHEIHFEDGKILHLSAGFKGAEVLKITKAEA